MYVVGFVTFTSSHWPKCCDFKIVLDRIYRHVLFSGEFSNLKVWNSIRLAWFKEKTGNAKKVTNMSKSEIRSIRRLVFMKICRYIYIIWFVFCFEIDAQDIYNASNEKFWFTSLMWLKQLNLGCHWLTILYISQFWSTFNELEYEQSYWFWMQCWPLSILV